MNLLIELRMKICNEPLDQGGGDSLIKVGTDVPRVQHLGQAKFLQET